MSAAFLLEVAKDLPRALASMALNGETLDRPTRKNISKAVRMLSDSVAALPATEERFSAIESATELDALVAGFDVLCGYGDAARNRAVARRLHLRARRLVMRATVVLDELLRILSAISVNEGTR